MKLATVAQALAMTVLSSGVGQTANAETWACTFISSLADEPTEVSYNLVSRHTLKETWASGATAAFQILQNDQYGLVGISSVSEMKPGETALAVAFNAVVIDRRAREFWLTSVATEGSDALGNGIDHGPCIKK